MNRSTSAIMFAAALMLAAACPADAGLVFYESFSEPSYPTGYINKSPDVGNSWTTVQGAPNDQIVAGSLDTTGTQALTPAGGKLAIAGDDTSRGVSLLPGGMLGADGTRAFVSFLMQVDGSTGAFSGLELWRGVPASDNNNRAMRAGAFNSNYEVATHTGTGAVAFSNNALHFVVLDFQFSPGNDVVDVYIDPTEADLLNGVFDGQFAGGNFSFDRVGLAQFNDAPTSGFIDEIRIGTLLSDVAAVTAVPTPAALPAGLALLALGVTRRRRH